MTPLHTTASAATTVTHLVDRVGVGWVIAAALAAFAVYVVACWLWPFAACLRCGGDGKNRSPTGGAWRTCARCGGTGARVRVGRQLVTAFRHTRKRGTRPVRTARTWKDLQK